MSWIRQKSDFFLFLCEQGLNQGWRLSLQITKPELNHSNESMRWSDWCDSFSLRLIFSLSVRNTLLLWVERNDPLRSFISSVYVSRFLSLSVMLKSRWVFISYQKKKTTSATNYLLLWGSLHLSLSLSVLKITGFSLLAVNGAEKNHKSLVLRDYCTFEQNHKRVHSHTHVELMNYAQGFVHKFWSTVWLKLVMEFEITRFKHDVERLSLICEGGDLFERGSLASILF